MKHSEIIFIMYSSGSMYGIASDMEGAMKEVISKQKDSDGEVLVTFVRFDDEYEEVFHEKNVNEIDGFKLEPRGGTALLDAIGKTVNTVERRFNQKDKSDQPERVLFVIVTDGEENSSTEFRQKSQIFQMIEKIKAEHNWGGTFIGANQHAMGEGNSYGVARGSSLNFGASAQGVRSMSKSVSGYVSDFLESGVASYDDQDKE